MWPRAIRGATARRWSVDEVKPRSLGWHTDLIFARFDGEVIERDGFLVVRTPSNPNFWWGNFLLFDAVPRAGDAANWLAAFDAEIGAVQSNSRPATFGIDASHAFELPADFVAGGFTLDTATVLTMRRDQLCELRKPADEATFRVAMLALPAQAPLAVDLQVASDAGEHESVEDYRSFRTRQMLRYGAMERAGLGHWFGVFTNDGELVADCGLFTDGALGRFQHVSTHPAWRRRGLCSTLIHAVCRHGFETMRLKTLVIVADPNDVAIGLYESVGFERGLSTWQMERRPPP